MKKIFTFAITLAVICVLLTSCKTTTITPYDHGYAVGTAAYIGYSRIAEKQGEDFSAKYAATWEVFDKAETPQEILTEIVKMTDLIKSDDLTDADRAALKALANLALSKVDPDALTPEMLEFLKGFRAGVDTLKAME